MSEKDLENKNQELLKQIQAEQQLSNMLSILLESNAKNRLNNIKLANKALYLKAAQTIIYLYQEGQLNGKLSEEDLKSLLQKINPKKEINIRRK